MVGYATIGLVVTVRRRPTRSAVGAMHDGSSGERRERRGPEGGYVRRGIQVLGIALMAAGLLLDTSVRSRNRRDGRTSDKHVTNRLPVVLLVIGAVLLVLSSL